MMRSQRIGNRYLAGLVIAFGVLYFALTCAETALGRRYWLNFVLLGLVPAMAALLLSLRAWSAVPGASDRYSAAGLIILIAALVSSRLGMVIF
jgi:hypothetical protein